MDVLLDLFLVVKSETTIQLWKIYKAGRRVWCRLVFTNCLPIHCLFTWGTLISGQNWKTYFFYEAFLFYCSILRFYCKAM